MKFRVTYLDPETQAETSRELTAPDRTQLEDNLSAVGIEPLAVEWIGDDLPLPLEHLELQDVGPVAVTAPHKAQDKSLLGCLATVGLLLASIDFFLLGLLGPLGDFFVLLLCGILLVVAQLRRS